MVALGLMALVAALLTQYAQQVIGIFDEARAARAAAREHVLTSAHLESLAIRGDGGDRLSPDDEPALLDGEMRENIQTAQTPAGEVLIFAIDSAAYSARVRALKPLPCVFEAVGRQCANEP
ncbi:MULTISPECIES: hypothetical protein [Hyphobacterium]|uniref:Flp pilus-assembly TadG-like N-terminal domain-containing protein n=1 Tax=Hyphobacterium vulgare TaxID=1736751 RepID=A0ABV6ZX08_9PROT